METENRMARRIVASLINDAAVGMCIVHLLKGRESDFTTLLGKMIPFDDAREKFGKSLEKYLSSIPEKQKSVLAGMGERELFAVMKKNQAIIEKYRKYAQKLVESADDPEGATFNGEDIERIKDPKGGKITWKFHTGAGSVYIMSENGMSHRIKSEQGKGDTGLHDWQELICFVKNDCSGSFDAGEVRSIEDALVHKRMNDPALKIFGDVSMIPKIGYNVFEIKKLGERHPTYHPGHEVARIDWKR